MKHLWKKITGLTAALLCMMMLAVPVLAEAEVPAELLARVEENSKGLIEELTGFTDEEITTYLENSPSPFVESALTAWQEVKEDLGALKETKAAEITTDDETITCVIPAVFEKYNADITVIYRTADYATQSLSFDVKYPLSYNMQQAFMNFILGVGIVFVMLIFLTFVISLFGKIFTEKKVQEAPKTEEVKEAPAAAVEAEEELADDTELVAVIAAAIAAAENTSTDSFVVRSIKKVNRKKWQNA